MKTAQVSLCIATYNWPEALQLCLRSIENQTILPTELIIGDDGSKENTRLLIESFRKTFPIPIIHIWQEDEGFRLAQIRNKMFAKASCNYIIQADGDLIFNKYFIEDHLRFAKQGTFIAGARSLINNSTTKAIIDNNTFLYRSFRNGLSKKYNALRCLPLGKANYTLKRGRELCKYVLGANMAFWKVDLLNVNGYNEDFTGWGKEDNDLAIRLCNAGVEIRSLKFAAIIYHLFHKGASAANTLQNERLLQNTIIQKTTTIENGMRQYLSTK